MRQYLSSLSAIIALGTPLLASEAPVPAWQAVGWGGGAYYFSTAWHPTDGSVLYLGSDCAGLYRSDNHAKTWTFANNGLTDYAVYCLAVSPAAPELLYALTDGGLCKSIDRAKTWNVVEASTGKNLDIRAQRDGTVRAIAVDPKNADVVYAGSRTGKLFKSTDGSLTWKELPYREALPAAPAPPAFSGNGALRVSYNGAVASGDAMGRMSRLYGPGKAAQDWSSFTKLSAQIQIPENSPAIQAQLIIQTGDSWQWQQGAWIEGKTGTWVEVPLELTSLKGLDSVRMMHVAIRTFQPGWKGDVLVDHVALQGMITTTAPANELIISDWEKIGDSDNWAANHQGSDFLKVTAIRQSQEQRNGDVVSSVAIASDGAIYTSNTKFGIFQSTDAGGTWKALDTPRKVMSIVVSPTNPRELWAACAADGLRRSADRGTTWESITLDGSLKPDIRDLALTAKNPDRIYALASIEWGGFLFHSDNHGTTWTKNNTVKVDMPGNPTLPEETGSGAFPKGYNGLSTVTNIAVNPQNPDEIMISANWRNVYSSDGGKTLEERSTGADNTCTTDLQFLGNKTYATAMDEGLFVSENDGQEWRQLLPLKYDANMSGHFWRVRAAQTPTGIYLVTTASPWQSYGNPKCANRAYVSTDGGTNFALSSAGLPDYVPNVNCMWGRSFPRTLALHPTDPNIVYMGMDGNPEPDKNLPGGGIFRSTDGGKNWLRCATQPGGLRMYYGLAIDPSNPQRLYYSSCGEGGGAWRSDDEGATWSHIFTNESWSFNLDVSPTGVVYVGGNELWRSADRGATWTQTTQFKTDATIVGIAIDPANEQRAWISRTTWDSSNRGGIWRTDDGGKSWQDITGDIPFRKPQILRYNAAKKELWAGGAGIFKIAQ